jgi:NADPH:quinone reductase-like Zn-dependent oxidoreductase
VYVVPDGISDEDAAQFSLNPITAWGLLHEARATAGDWIAGRAQMVDALWRAIAERSITLPVKARYALDQAALAIDELRPNPGGGKVLLCTS